ncbi:YncE family protein [Pseudomonas sp. NPDC089569]|uniref:YncE family protein n=1 Tax=Pseudomonas sp. NPDC089569 TaxID=3390722 RepID=UPI003D007111
MKTWSLLFLLVSAMVNAAPAPDARVYHREQQVTLPGSGDSWGFVALDPTRPYLFLARRENGLSVFDVSRQRLIKTVEGSEGANGVVFVPPFNRAYVLNTDGSLGVLELSSLKLLKRIAIAQSNLNSAVYEPGTGQVIIVSGRRADRSTLFVFDPKQERIVADHELDVKKIDPLLLKGDGSFFLPMRDEGKVARFSARTFAILDTWQFDGCPRPSALAQDIERKRLFVACRGDEPRLVVADLDTGAVKASLPITRDVNAVAFDADNRRLLIPSGVDANLTVIRQLDADHYQVQASISTLPMAYNMAFDEKSKKVYLPAMDFTQAVTVKGQPKLDPVFHADTFSVTTLAP